MRILTAMAAGLSLLAITPAIAKSDKPVDPNKKICRSYPTTGSILGTRRECHTRAEWVQVDEANRANTRRFSDATERNGGLRQQ